MPEQQKTAEQTSGVSANTRGRILHQWEFPEYERHNRGPVWYVLAFAIGTALIVYALKDGNPLFALIILLFALILFTNHRQEPMQLNFTMYETGIQVGDTFFLFREIETFSVIYEPPTVKVLYLMPKNRVLRGEITIPLRDQNPVEVRRMLLEYLKEDLDRDEETHNDKLGRLLKL